MAVSRRKFLAGGAGGATALVAMAACGPAQTQGSGAPEVKFGEPVTATFWHTQTGANEKALTDVVTKFNASNGKNITLRGEFQGNYTQVYQKIMASIQAGSPPDVAVAYESMVAEYMKANAVVDLDDYASKGPLALTKADTDDIFPQYISSQRYPQFNNKLLSYPFTKSLAVNYYNEDLLKAAGATKFTGWTFDEYKKLVAAATKQVGGQTTVYGNWVNNDTSYIDAFIYANGGELLNKENTKVTFNQEPGVQVFQMWGDMAKAGQAYTSKGFDWQADFGNAKSANAHSSSTSYTFLRDAMKEGAKQPWGIGLTPQKDPAKPQTVMFGGNITVFRTTPIKQAASWEWIKFFTNKENTVAFAIASSYMPLRKSAAESADLKRLWTTDPQAKQAFELTPYARAEPGIPAWQDIRTILQDAQLSVMTGRATAKAALDEAAKQADKLIEEKR